MDPIFTEYVRSLDPGEEPEAESFAKLWSTLRGALFNEMKKRRLWQVHPSRLGVFGRASWSEPGAFEELTSDCYVYVFLDRLPALKAQLAGKDNVEGLVFRNVRNFLHDAGKKNDPLGFHTFSVLRRAVRRLVDRGVLATADARLGRGTVLAFAGAVGGAPADRAELEPHVRTWCDELAIDILAGRGRRLARVVRVLARRIAGLPAHGVAAVRFGDLADLTTGAVRRRWSALRTLEGGETAFEKDDDGSVRRVRTVRPEAAFEDGEAFAGLCARVDRSLRRQRTSEALRRLWGLLRRDAEDGEDERAPSHRQIARVLGVTRHQLAGLLGVLGKWVAELPAA
jgi:hypothetical protein